jgi:hypothetical protein
MAQQAAVLTPSARIVRWLPPVAAERDEPECRTVWRDNVARQQDFQTAHPDVIWPHRELWNAPWVAYVPMPDGAFLEVTDSAELGRLLDKLAIAVAHRDARRERAA